MSMPEAALGTGGLTNFAGMTVHNLLTSGDTTVLDDDDWIIQVLKITWKMGVKWCVCMFVFE